MPFQELEAEEMRLDPNWTTESGAAKGLWQKYYNPSGTICDMWKPVLLKETLFSKCAKANHNWVAWAGKWS